MVRKHAWLACPLVISWFPSPTISLFRAMEGCKRSPPLKTAYPLYKFSSLHIFIHSHFSHFREIINEINEIIIYVPFYNIRKMTGSFRRGRVYFLIRKFAIREHFRREGASFHCSFTIEKILIGCVANLRIRVMCFAETLFRKILLNAIWMSVDLRVKCMVHFLNNIMQNFAESKLVCFVCLCVAIIALWISMQYFIIYIYIFINIVGIIIGYLLSKFQSLNIKTLFYI